MKGDIVGLPQSHLGYFSNMHLTYNIKHNFKHNNHEIKPLLHTNHTLLRIQK
jgi:hypothetical protein